MHGFESVMAVLDMKDKQKETAFAQAFMQDLDKYVTNVKQSRLSVIEALDEIDLSDLEGYGVHQTSENTFTLIHPDAGKKEFAIQMKQVDGRTTFEGLPNQMRAHLNRFSQEEQKRHPLTVLSVILRLLYSPKQELHTNEEASRRIFQAAKIRPENPLKYYRIVPGKGTRGGYSHVYMCERMIDGAKFALKLAKPRN